MSLATLKRKTAHKYNNSSVNGKQFSINGSFRNQGYIGQTSLSRTILRTPARGPDSQGFGTCCGSYTDSRLSNSSTCSTEDNDVIKRSVLSYKGMIQKRTQWARRPLPFSNTKPSDAINLNSSGDYLIYKRKKAIKDVREAIDNCDAPGYKPSGKCCAVQYKPVEQLGVSKSQSEYIYERIDKCTDLDVHYIHHTQNSGPPVPTCGGT